jgi:cbb3-type cytochrome oxidase subunit 1
MKASTLSFFIAVTTLAVGMAWGIVMAISKDHSAMPAHAHLNLLGWVSLFLFGVFYRLHPSLDLSRIAKIQILIWVAGTAILTIGVAMLHAGNPGGEPYAGFGSMVVFADLFLFGWLVFKHERAVIA